MLPALKLQGCCLLDWQQAYASEGTHPGLPELCIGSLGQPQKDCHESRKTGTSSITRCQARRVSDSPSLCWGLVLQGQDGHGVRQMAHNAAQPEPCSEEVPLPELGRAGLLLGLRRNLCSSRSQILQDEQSRPRLICMPANSAQNLSESITHGKRFMLAGAPCTKAC